MTSSPSSPSASSGSAGSPGSSFFGSSGAWLRGCALAALLGVGTSAVGCGYILHPERRGQNGGLVDGTTLVFDLLWLIPGILPGVIFLIVDFTSGTMYVGGGGRHALNTLPNGDLRVALDDQPANHALELRVVTETTHRVIGDGVVMVGPEYRGQLVDLTVAAHAGEKAFLVVADADQPTHVLQKPIAIP